MTQIEQVLKIDVGVCSLLCMNLSIYLPVCLSVIYLYTYLSTYLYVHPSIPYLFDEFIIYPLIDLCQTIFHFSKC